MIQNEIDKFRTIFFDKVIKEEKDRENALILLQTNCFHQYNIIDNTLNEYQQRTCSKCGISSIKKIKIWEGTKTCIIM